MAAGKYSFLIEQGATFTLELQWKDANGNPFNLTGYAARMQIRPTIESDIVYLTLSSSLNIDGTGINMSGSNGTTSPTSGSLGMLISAPSSSLLTFDEGFYDLELTSSTGVVTRLLEGKVRISKEITR